jgi:hypothetical protein
MLFAIAIVCSAVSKCEVEVNLAAWVLQFFASVSLGTFVKLACGTQSGMFIE